MGVPTRIEINRAPVLTLWATVVAERLGYARDEALTLGRAVAGLNAHSKAKSLGLVGGAADDGADASPTRGARRAPLARGYAEVELLHRRVLVRKGKGGLRAVTRDAPIEPASVERYLATRFGAALPAVERAMRTLAGSRSPQGLRHEAYALYERFRPEIPAGQRGWGAAGVLDLERIATLGGLRRPGARSARAPGSPTQSVRGRGSTKVRRASAESSVPRG